MKKVALAALGLLAAVAWLPGVVDPATSARWAVLAVGIPLLLLLYERVNVPAGRDIYVCLGLIAMSVLWTPEPLDGIYELAHLLILGSAVFLGSTAGNISPLWKGMALGVSVSAALAVAQMLGFDWVEQAVVPGGLFMNKNMLAEAGLITLIPMAIYGKWRLAIGPVVAILLGGSKAVYVALAVVALFALYDRGRDVRPVLFTALGAAVLWIVFGDHESFLQRLQEWTFALEDPRWFGHGLGSYSAAYPDIQYAHSEYLHAFYELGVLALYPLGIFLYAMQGKDHEAERLTLIAILIVGLAAFPLRLPLTGLAAALALGRLARSRDHLHQQNIRRRAALKTLAHRGGALAGR